MKNILFISTLLKVTLLALVISLLLSIFYFILKSLDYYQILLPFVDIQSLVLWFCFLRAITDLICHHILDQVIDMSLKPTIKFLPRGGTKYRDRYTVLNIDINVNTVDVAEEHDQVSPFVCNIFQQNVRINSVYSIY